MTIPTSKTFERLYADHARFIRRALRRFGVSDVAMDDAVQDVFIAAFRRLSTFEGRSTLRTWLYGIALHVARDHYKRERRTRGREELSADLAESTPIALTPDAEAERAEAIHILDQILGELDTASREVLVLAEIEGLAGPEIATVLGLGLNVVYSRLRVARARFEQAAKRRRARDRGVLALSVLIDAGRSDLCTGLEGADTWRAPLDRITRPTALHSGVPGATSVGGGAAAIKMALAALVVTAAVSDPLPRGANARPHATDPTPTVTRPRAIPPTTSPAAAPWAAQETATAPTTKSHPKAAIPVRRRGPRAPEPSPAEGSRAERSPPQGSPGGGSLAEEARLLREALSLLKLGRATAALAALRMHATRHPAGTLAPERAAAEVTTLCKLGKLGEAETNRQSFLERWPTSPLAARVRRGCPQTNDGGP